MFEVCPLTLFHIFFKSILQKALSFGLPFYLLCTFSPNIFAKTREITLFPHQDLQILESTDESKKIRLGLTESIVNTSFSPCYIVVNQIPLLYSVFQIGISCAQNLSDESTFAFSLSPETNYGKDVNSKGLALGLGLSYNYSLFPKERTWLFFVELNYKFWDNELIDSSYKNSNQQLYQIWGNVFDSNYRIGLLRNFQELSHITHTSVSLMLYYLQSLPLEWRQIGGARNTASFEYKALGFSVRSEFFSHLVLGAGIAYWNLTFDGIRISAPLPDIYLGIDF